MAKKVKQLTEKQSEEFLKNWKDARDKFLEVYRPFLQIMSERWEDVRIYSGYDISRYLVWTVDILLNLLSFNLHAALRHSEILHRELQEDVLLHDLQDQLEKQKSARK